MRLAMGDRSRQWLVGLGVVVLFLSLFGNFYQLRSNAEQAATYHMSSVRRDAELERLLQTVIVIGQDNHATVAQVAALQKQVAQVIDGLPPSVQYLGALVAGFERQVQSVCNAVHASCATLPVALPGTAPPPTSHPVQPRIAPTSTTTTVPHHGKGHR